MVRTFLKLNDVADFMKRNAQVSIRIEGNCDERGTEEFNRAGHAARRGCHDLVSRGIDPTRIQMRQPVQKVV